MDNLKRHPNPLTQLRLFNFFCIFHLVRYMALLEAFYCGENIRPVLLDFSGIAPSQSSVARASEMAYTQMHKSINRFYAWGYAQKLKEKDYSKEDLLQSETPVYDEKKKASVEFSTLWNLAKERASACATDDAARLVFGETTNCASWEKQRNSSCNLYAKTRSKTRPVDDEGSVKWSCGVACE